MKEFLVISRTNGTTRTGSPYALLKVADTIETLNVAVWDLTPESKPEVGQLVKSRGKHYPPRAQRLPQAQTRAYAEANDHGPAGTLEELLSGEPGHP